MAIGWFGSDGCRGLASLHCPAVALPSEFSILLCHCHCMCAEPGEVSCLLGVNGWPLDAITTGTKTCGLNRLGDVALAGEAGENPLWPATPTGVR